MSLYQFTLNYNIGATLKFIFCVNDMVRVTRWTHIHHHIKGQLQFSAQKQSLNKAISLSIWAWPHFIFSCSFQFIFSPHSYFMVLTVFSLSFIVLTSLCFSQGLPSNVFNLLDLIMFSLSFPYFNMLYSNNFYFFWYDFEKNLIFFMFVHWFFLRLYK